MVNADDLTGNSGPGHIANHRKVGLWQVGTKDEVFSLSAFGIDSGSFAAQKAPVDFLHAGLDGIVAPETGIFGGVVFVGDGQTAVMVLDNDMGKGVIVREGK